LSAALIIGLVVLALVGLLLGLRTRLGNPPPDVMDRAKQRARDQAAAEQRDDDRDA
jgi:hypothetical protein